MALASPAALLIGPSHQMITSGLLITSIQSGAIDVIHQTDPDSVHLSR